MNGGASAPRWGSEKAALRSCNLQNEWELVGRRGSHEGRPGSGTAGTRPLWESSAYKALEEHDVAGTWGQREGGNRRLGECS